MNISTIPDNVVRAGRMDWNNKASATVPANVSYVAQTGTFTPGTDAGGPRVLTLPDAAAFGVGKTLVIADESASVRPWYSIALTPAAGQSLCDVVGETKELVWPREGIELVSTGAGWFSRGSNVTPTLRPDPQRGVGREQVCMENDFSCITQFNAAPPEVRNFGANNTITNSSPNEANRAIYCLMTTAAGWHKLSSELSGQNNGQRKTQWAEFTASFDAVPANNSLSFCDWGLVDTLTSAAATANGVFFRFFRDSGRTNWTLISANGGVSTGVISGIALTTTTFTRFTLGVEINDTQTAAHYFINGAFAGTINTNIPNASRALSPCQSIMGNGGSGANIHLDRWRHHYDAQVSGNRN